MLCTTADAAPAAGDFVTIRHNIEGQNVQQFLKGTASAKPFTMSFWVKSNVTGTYIVRMQDQDNGRSVSASYTVSASATCDNLTVREIVEMAITTGGLDRDSVTVQYEQSERGWLGDVPLVRLSSDKIRALGWVNKYSSREAMQVAFISRWKEVRGS